MRLPQALPLCLGSPATSSSGSGSDNGQQNRMSTKANIETVIGVLQQLLRLAAIYPQGTLSPSHTHSCNTHTDQSQQAASKQG